MAEHGVIPSDREAAWLHRPDCYSFSDHAAWMAGRYDYAANPISSFAAHRIAHTAPLEAKVKALEGEIEGLQFMTSVIENPDRQLCCSGHHCGCQGATVGQYAAWAMKEAEARATLRSQSLPPHAYG